MEPFSIQCQACQAKLKVTKPALLGKQLPCPKCQSTVAIPETHHATDEHADASTQGGMPTAPESLGGFDDVDDLLSRLPAAPEQQPKPPPTPKPNFRGEATGPQNGTDPIEPEVLWDNPAAAKTRRTLALAAAATGAILLAAVGSYALFFSSPKNPIARVAENDSTLDETPPPDRPTNLATPDSTHPNLAASDGATGAQPASAPNDTADPETASKGPEALTTEPLITSSQPPPIDVTEPPLTVKSNTEMSVSRPVPKPLTQKPDATTGSPTPSPEPASKSPPAPNPILQPVAPASSALGELSALLEESGSSISAITDATASAAATETIGLPKYYFQASNSTPVDIDRQLGQPCAGLRYRDVPIIEILRDTTAISGIPISIDTASLVDRLVDGIGTGQRQLIPNISVDVADTDFRQAAEAIAQEAKWTIAVNEAGVVLTDPEASNLVRKTVDLSPIAVLGDEGLGGVVDSIKAMIAADSWFVDDRSFRLERKGMSLTVHHFPPVVRKVERFIDRVFAAIQLTQSDAANREALKETLATRLSLAEPSLSAPCELSISSRSTLDHLLNRIREKTGVDVIANWQTLAALEWTPQMTVPGNVSEPTLDKMLRQLERSIDATAIVLDAHTIELTHPLDALRRSYVEFYLISDLLERNFTPQKAIQLVHEAIENAGQPAATTIFDPRCECIILASPQSTHRIVEAVLKEIK